MESQQDDTGHHPHDLREPGQAEYDRWCKSKGGELGGKHLPPWSDLSAHVSNRFRSMAAQRAKSEAALAVGAPRNRRERRAADSRLRRSGIRLA